jgi:hypothetical protein
MTNAADSSATVQRSFGFHAPEEALSDVQSDFPGVTLTRPFISGVLDDPEQIDLAQKVRKACAESWEHGMVPVYSFKLHPGQVREGRWDGALRDLAEWHLDQAPAMAVLWHEPENDTNWFGTGGQKFARYFNHVAGEIRKQNTALPLVFSAMAYQWEPGRDSTENSEGWNEVKADLRSCDVYSGNTDPLGVTLGEHPGFQRWLRLMAPTGTYGLTERGFTLRKNPNGAPIRAGAIKREAAWLRDTPDGRRCSLYLYWSSLGAENDKGMPVSDHAGREAIRELFAALRQTAVPTPA